MFAEGLAVVSGQLVQLTYKENIALAYTGSELTAYIPHAGEAWGLTSLNGELVQSNGSAKLAFLDAKTLNVKRTITVRDSSGKLPLLNELEAARGTILANVFGQCSSYKLVYQFRIQTPAVNGAKVRTIKDYFSFAGSMRNSVSWKRPLLFFNVKATRYTEFSVVMRITP